MSNLATSTHSHTLAITLRRLVTDWLAAAWLWLAWLPWHATVPLPRDENLGNITLETNLFTLKYRVVGGGTTVYINSNFT